MADILKAHGIDATAKGKSGDGSGAQRAGKTVPSDRIPKGDASRAKSSVKKRKRDSNSSDDDDRKRRKSSLDSTKANTKAKMLREAERRKSLTSSGAHDEASLKQKRSGPINSLSNALLKETALAAQCLSLPENSPALADKIRELATQIEEALFAASGNAISEYYQKQYKSVVLNLSNIKYSQLRRRVLTGELVPQRLVTMTPEEFLPAELVQQQKQREEKMLEMKIKRDEGNKESILMNLVVSTPAGVAPILLAENVSLTTPPVASRGAEPVEEQRTPRRASLAHSSVAAGADTAEPDSPQGLRGSNSSIAKSPRAPADAPTDYLRSSTPPPPTLSSSRDATPYAPPTAAPKFDLSSIQVDDFKATGPADLEDEPGSSHAETNENNMDPNDPFSVASLGTSSPRQKSPEKIWFGTLAYPGQLRVPVGVKGILLNPAEEALSSNFPLDLLPGTLTISNRTDYAEMMKYLQQIGPQGDVPRSA